MMILLMIVETLFNYLQSRSTVPTNRPICYVICEGILVLARK